RAHLAGERQAGDGFQVGCRDHRDAHEPTMRHRRRRRDYGPTTRPNSCDRSGGCGSYPWMRLAFALLIAACGHSSPGAGPDAPLTGGGDAAGGDAPPALCGGETCRADQSCAGDHCAFTCTGSQVPGDYATVEAAAVALRDVTGAVICLGPASYPAPDLIVDKD